MKVTNSWWLVSMLGLCVGLGSYAAGCGEGSSNNSTGGAGGEGGSSSSTGTSMGGSGGAGGKINGDNLGLECTSDTDCGTGLTCLVPDKDDPTFQGGPQNGYCSMACQKSSDCPGVGASCYKGLNGTAMEGRCVLGCEIGPGFGMQYSPFKELDPAKCHGREDARCQRNADGDMCLPTCSNDAACGAGRVCQLTAGVCVDMQQPGKKLGEVCDPKGMPECSTGLCVGGLSNGMGICSGYCTLGGSPNQGECGGVDQGLCLIPPNITPCAQGELCSDAGDFGFCVNACTTQDDCAGPDLWCRTVLQGAPSGYCFFVPDCPMGQADCAALQGTTCTQTKFGPRCLEAKFPLGMDAPTDGGMGGGGGAGGGGMGGAGGAGGAGGQGGT